IVPRQGLLDDIDASGFELRNAPSRGSLIPTLVDVHAYACLLTQGSLDCQGAVDVLARITATDLDEEQPVLFRLKLLPRFVDVLLDDAVTQHPQQRDG